MKKLFLFVSILLGVPTLSHAYQFNWQGGAECTAIGGTGRVFIVTLTQGFNQPITSDGQILCTLMKAGDQCPISVPSGTKNIRVNYKGNSGTITYPVDIRCWIG